MDSLGNMAFKAGVARCVQMIQRAGLTMGGSPAELSEELVT